MKKRKHLFLIGIFIIPIFFIVLMSVIAGGVTGNAESFSSSAGSLNITPKDLEKKEKK